MEKKFTKYLFLFLYCMLPFLIFSGCVDFEQNTIFNKDGSGSMHIHYWSKEANVKSTEKLLDYGFNEKIATKNLSSINSKVSKITIEYKPEDSTRHVWAELNFEKIANIRFARSFKDIKAEWNEESDSYEFIYNITEVDYENKYEKESYIANYSFEMPGKVISSNATRVEGKTCYWDLKLSDINNGYVLTAKVSK